ncbi:MAG: c-type cytochrome [Crocinitomicaceae bacterium]|nr:c-type cytochrome [Crocinitomicaceae bacterium]
MIKLINTKTLIVVAGLVLSFSGMAQQDATEVVEASRPMYERFGMTSTELFLVMLSFTLVLVFVLVGLAFSAKQVIASKMTDKLKNGNPKAILLLLGLMTSGISFAGGEYEQISMEIPFPDESFWLFVTIDVLLILVILYFVKLIKSFTYDIVPPTKRKWMKRFQKTMVDAQPIEDEDAILLDHDYDGIRELDNNLPPWWKWGFYITIVWSVAYLAYYMLPGGGMSQKEEFLHAMEEGKLQVAEYKASHPELVTAESAVFLNDPSTISKGASIYDKNCKTCHKEQGAGGAGPNLTDNYWIYGEPTMKTIFTTIYDGGKNGMKSWKNELNGLEIQAVASYILQLDPILPPNGQEGKGDYYPPELKEKPAEATE